MLHAVKQESYTSKRRGAGAYGPNRRAIPLVIALLGLGLVNVAGPACSGNPERAELIQAGPDVQAFGIAWYEPMESGFLLLDDEMEKVGFVASYGEPHQRAWIELKDGPHVEISVDDDAVTVKVGEEAPRQLSYDQSLSLGDASFAFRTLLGVISDEGLGLRECGAHTEDVGCSRYAAKKADSTKNCTDNPDGTTTCLHNIEWMGCYSETCPTGCTEGCHCVWMKSNEC
jgi:hypothetical protein